jgi:PIN domain nuclease of toxin-antitoxin system
MPDKIPELVLTWYDNGNTMPLAMKKTSATFRLSDEARRLLEESSRRLGVSRTSVVEMAIRLFAEQKPKRSSGNG